MKQYKRGSVSRLTEHSIEYFPEDTLFGQIARTVCKAGCLPRKELFEAWEVARRVRRRFRGQRIFDLACGHGLLGYLLLILDDTSPEAIGVDRRIPPSADKIAAVLEDRWPRLRGRMRRIEAKIETTGIKPEDLIVSVHACGLLTDKVLSLALDSRASVAVLPCCHSLSKCDQGRLNGWMDGALAIDATRAARLRHAGYTVHTQTIPDDITPMNRLLLGQP